VIVVVDASVALKWFFQGRSGEDHVDKALAVLRGVADERVKMIQPPHFVAEVAAVLARERPDTAVDDVANLQQIDWRTVGDERDHRTATELSARFKGHVFDTLYHAVALNRPNATLITADRRHYSQYRQFGLISLLSDFELA